MDRSIITRRDVLNSQTAIKGLRKKVEKMSLNLDDDIHSTQKTNIVAQRLSEFSSLSSGLLDEDLVESHVPILKNQRMKLIEQQEKFLMEQAKDGDTYVTKLLKYIPVEVIGFYMALSSIVHGAKDTANIVYYSIGIIVTGVVATILYLSSVGKVKSRTQILISCIAFLAWTFSIDANIAILPTVKALLLPTATFLLPLIDPPSQPRKLTS